MIVQEFINEVSRRLRDVGKKQWDDDFLISATNAALGALCTTMPQAFTVNRDLILAAGVEQVIDPDLHKIVSFLHNVSSVDGTPRRAVTKAEMSVFDAAYPHWRQDIPRKYIRHWMTDELDESKFYVWPPANADRGAEPAIPAVPVDPGALGAGGDSQILRGSHVRNGYPELLVHRQDDNVIENFSTWEADVIWDITAWDTANYNTYISTQVDVARNFYTSDYTGVLSFSNLLYENGTPITHDDPRLVTGAVVRIAYGSSQAELVGINIRVDGVTQTEVDAYQAELVAYNAAVAVHTAWEAAEPLAHIIRGTFTKTPFITATPAPEVPMLPVPPVDPGALTNGGTPYTLYNGYITDISFGSFSNKCGMILRHTDGSGETDAQALYDADFFVVELDRVDPTALGGIGRSPQRIFPEGGGVEDPNWAIWVVADSLNVTMQGDDSRFVPGQFLLMETPLGTNRSQIQDFDFSYSLGTTQEQIDAYQAALLQYNNDLATYNLALANLAAYNADDSVVRVDDELPVKRAHIPALQEFAMYYAYSVDDDLTANSGRAQRHWLAFFQMLNKREDANMMIGQARETTE